MVEEAKKALALIFQPGVAHFGEMEGREFAWRHEPPWKAREGGIEQIRSRQRRPLFKHPPISCLGISVIQNAWAAWNKGGSEGPTKKRLVAAGWLFHLRQAGCPWSPQKGVRVGENIIPNKMAYR